MKDRTLLRTSVLALSLLVGIPLLPAGTPQSVDLGKFTWSWKWVPRAEIPPFTWTDCQGKEGEYDISSVVWNDVAYNPNPPHPDDPEAILVGGWPGCLADPKSGFAAVAIVNRSGMRVVWLSNHSSQLYKVSFHPDGSYALIVGAYDTVLKYKNGVVQDIFTNSEFYNLTVKVAQAHLWGRDVKFRPDGRYALITGTDILLAYNESRGFRALFIPSKIPGNKDAYLFKTIGWAPNSSFAFLSGARKVLNGSFETTFPCGQYFPGEDPASRCELGTVMLYSEGSWWCSRFNLNTPCVVYLFNFGQGCDPKICVPGWADVNGIVFEPSGKTAWFVGLQRSLKGTLLKWCLGGCSKKGYEFQWNPYVHPGSLQSISWQPGGERGLITAYNSNFTLILEKDRVTPALNQTLCKSIMPPVRWNETYSYPRTCGRFGGVAWAPNGLEALVVGYADRTGSQVLRYLLNATPSVVITSPSDNQLFRSETILFIGVARAYAPGRSVEDVEYRIDDGPWKKALAVAAGLTSTWIVQWNATEEGVSYGNHTFSVRGFDKVQWSDIRSIRFRLAPPLPPLEAPTLEPAKDLATGRVVEEVEEGFFTLNWTTVANATLYEIQETTNLSRGWDFSVREFRTSPPFDVYCRPAGNYSFRVLARGEAPASLPSNVVTVRITKGCLSQRGPPSENPPVVTVQPRPITPTTEILPPPPSTPEVGGPTPPPLSPSRLPIPGPTLALLALAVAIVLMGEKAKRRG